MVIEVTGMFRNSLRALEFLTLLAFVAGAQSRWTQREELPPIHKLEGILAAGDTLLAYGPTSGFRSMDGGITWQSSLGNTLSYYEGGIRAGGQFVLVGWETDQNSNKCILTSPDGVQWTARSAPRHTQLYDVTWTGTQYVAVGAQGAVLVSPDGKAWESRESGTRTNLTAVAWTGTQLVAMGFADSAYLSQDGVSWTAVKTGFSGLNSMAWTGTRLIASGGSSRVIVSSEDGSTWTARGQATHDITSVRWVGKQALAVGPMTWLTSPDGISWTNVPMPGNMAFADVAKVGSRYVVVGGDYGRGQAFTSENGLDWTARSRDAAEDITGLVWTGSRMVTVAAERTVRSSPDGITWNQIHPKFQCSLASLVWSGNHMVAVGDSLAYVSSDGNSWTESKTGLRLGNKVMWARDRFVASSSNGGVAVSADGESWTLNTHFNFIPRDIAQGDSLFVAIAGFKIYTSPDGEIWTQRRSPCESVSLNAITWTGTTYVAVGGTGGICRSPDGILWTKEPPVDAYNYTDVIWTGRQLVAVGGYASVAVSQDDGKTWTAIRAVSNDKAYQYNLNSIAWTGSLFVAVGAGGVILTSPDDLTAGMAPAYPPRGITLYAKGCHLNFRLSGSSEWPLAWATIASLDGRTHLFRLAVPLAGGQGMLPLDALRPGRYMLRVETGNQERTGAFTLGP